MATTTTRTGNVVADVTAHVQRLAASSNPASKVPQTPAQYAAACGYPGSKASALRQHIARQHGQGAVRTGHGRYPAVTPAQMLTLLGVGHTVRKPDTTAQAKAKASTRVAALLWAKGKASKQGAAQATAQAKGSKAKRAAKANPATARKAAVQRARQLGATEATAQAHGEAAAQAATHGVGSPQANAAVFAALSPQAQAALERTAQAS